MSKKKKRKPEVLTGDGYRPNYKGECLVCDQSPTVQIVEKGRVVHDTGMCGPCAFGSAECIDPENW